MWVTWEKIKTVLTAPLSVLWNKCRPPRQKQLNSEEQWLPIRILSKAAQAQKPTLDDLAFQKSNFKLVSMLISLLFLPFFAEGSPPLLTILPEVILSPCSGTMFQGESNRPSLLEAFCGQLHLGEAGLGPPGQHHCWRWGSAAPRPQPQTGQACWQLCRFPGSKTHVVFKIPKIMSWIGWR